MAQHPAKKSVKHYILIEVEFLVLFDYYCNKVSHCGISTPVVQELPKLLKRVRLPYAAFLFFELYAWTGYVVITGSMSLFAKNASIMIQNVHKTARMLKYVTIGKQSHQKKFVFVLRCVVLCIHEYLNGN